ncbi:MAG TPA: zinc ribbon domain-containing protein [Casimicrobiaceae bacterium]|nr:zinc ribbon domain-containing protein [Casimicrobiaceae bacterium]
MPIYEYRCSACGKELEALQKLSEAPLKTCPACHADTLVKRVSAAGFQLKGSGWYVTDFRGSGKPAASKKDGADGGAESKGDGKTETSSEAKSEAKSETKSETKTDGASTTSSSGSGSSAASS